MRHTQATKIRKARAQGLSLSRQHETARKQLSRLRRADKIAAATVHLASIEARLDRTNSRTGRLFSL